MALMTVKDQGDENFRNRARWSANKKMDVVMRLLRGEQLDKLSRELGIEAHRLAAWRDDFIAGGKEALKSNVARGEQTEEERRRKAAEQKVGGRRPEKGGSRSRRRGGRGERTDRASALGCLLGAESTAIDGLRAQAL